jgi:hypothetical protein
LELCKFCRVDIFKYNSQHCDNKKLHLYANKAYCKNSILLVYQDLHRSSGQPTSAALLAVKTQRKPTQFREQKKGIKTFLQNLI